MRLESRMEVGVWNGKLCQFEFGFVGFNLHFMRNISDVMTSGFMWYSFIPL